MISLILGGSAFANTIDCNDSVPEAIQEISDALYPELRAISEDEARQDPRIIHSSDESYELDLSSIEGDFEDTKKKVYAKLDELLEIMNNPRTAEEKKSADGFKGEHKDNRIFDDAGFISIKKSFPFVGDQGIDISYEFDNNSKKLKLKVRKSSFAKWEQDVEPRIYEFLGQILES
jgi:hypothetical protein